MVLLFLTYIELINELLFNKFSTLNIEFYVNSSNDILLIPLQNYLYIETNETSLVFFRVINLSNKEINTLTTYTIYPSNAAIYLNKIQCFCFETLHIKPKESIDLPILFFISNSVLNEPSIIKKIIIFYDMHNIDRQ